MKSLLVTGGAGFIGSNFVHYWLGKYPNDKVVVLDALTYAGNRANLESVEENPNFVFVHGDICDTPLVELVDPKGAFSHGHSDSGLHSRLELPLLGGEGDSRRR